MYHTIIINCFALGEAESLLTAIWNGGTAVAGCSLHCCSDTCSE